MKDFILIGNKNSITHKDFFKLMMDRRVNIGYTRPGEFDQPEGTPLKTLKGLTRWFTTLSVDDKPSLTLTATYSPEKYPKYDNYDAINVNRVQDIPYDYDGVIGCPITIFDHNLDNIEIVWKGGDIEWAEQSGIFTPPPQDVQNEYKHNDKTWRVQNPYYIENNKPVIPYNRIFIKLDGCLYGDHTIIDGKYIKGHTPILNGKHLYARVLIKKKKKEFPMDKYSIIDEISKQKLVEEIVYNVGGLTDDDLKDLVQDIYISLLEKEDELIISLYKTNQLKYYIVRMAKNNIYSKNSPYYMKYKKQMKNKIDIDTLYDKV